MSRVETIGDATLYFSLSRSQRCRLRKKGIAIPTKPRPRGYTQAPEQVEKRKRAGAASHHWQGDKASPKAGRKRAIKLYREIGPCEECGAVKTERHHKDENPANNHPSNIAILCRKCHMAAHRALKAGAHA